MILDFSKQTIERVAESFEEMTFGRGLAYGREGRVKIVSDGEWPVVAKVLGSGMTYVVTLYYEGRRQFDGECSCPVAIDCKHAAATALVVLEAELANEESYTARRQQLAVSSWLSELGVVPLSVKPSSASNKVIAYILERDEGETELSIHRTTRLKRGGLSRSSRMTAIGDPTKKLADWITADDVRRIALVRALSRSSFYESSYGVAALGADLFEELSETGLLFWDNVNTLPLRWGPTISESLGWHPSDEEEDALVLGLGSDMIVLSASRPLYVDLRSRTIGPLDLGVPDHLVERLTGGPAVPKSMVPTAEESLRSLRSLDASRLQISQTRPPQESLQPRLRVCVETSTRFGTMLDIALEAIYGSQVFKIEGWDEADSNIPRFPKELPPSESDPLRVAVIRNIAEEAHFANQAARLLYYGETEVSGAQGDREVAEAAHYIATQVVPLLHSHGWICDLSEDFPAELPIMDADWVEELVPVQGAHNWFELGLDVSIAGRRVPLLPLLLQAIRSGEIVLRQESQDHDFQTGANLRLPDGDLVHVPHSRLKRWLRPLIELQLRGLDDERKLIVPGVTAVELADALPGRFSESKALAELRERLAALVDLKPLTEGKNFQGELRAYQREGLAWLRFLHDGGLGGVLADDMGLGKTVQLLAFFDGLRASRKLEKGRPILVVAPRSVVGNWKLEAERFTPHLSSTLHLGSNRASSLDALTKHPIVITSYQTLLRDIELFLTVPWTSLVLDEAQAVKNPKTKLRRAVARIKATSVFCVTGTPIENHLGELWSQVDLAMPGVLGTSKTFTAVFRRPIETTGDTRALELLRQRIRPFLLRRTKDEVDIDLPEKTDIVERVPLDTAQRDLYESLRLILDKDVRRALKSRGVEGSSLIILDALLKLRQCCCDPRLVKIPEARKAKRSAKLDRLMAMLSELQDAGRFTLVFSQFTTMLDLIASECEQSDIPFLKLTGRTRDREKVIQAFQAGQAPVFLISLKAGGVGLNLTRADTVIHYDPWWNPAAENQATDRAHRIGQTKNLMVYKLVAESTLEERICVMQKEKQQLTNAALREGGITHFGADDIRALFQSL